MASGRFLYSLLATRYSLFTTRPKHIGILTDLSFQILVIPNDDHPIPEISEFTSDEPVLSPLFRIVMNASVAEDAYVGLVEEVGNAVVVLQLHLCLIGQAAAGPVEMIYEPAFQLGA